MVRSGLSVLPPEGVDAVHGAALRMLETVGVKLTEPAALELLAERGAHIYRDARRAYLPPALVAEAVRQVRPGFDLYSRDGTHPIPVGGPEVVFSNATYDAWVYDFRTGRREASTLAHQERFVRLNDALGAADVVGAQVVARDVPPPLQQVRAAETLLRNTTRPFVMNFNHPDECRTVLRMASAVAGGEAALRSRPFVIVSACPDSPLRYDAPVTETLRVAAAEWGVPIGIGPCPILGVSAPVTVAGAVAQAVAEMLAGVVLVKALNPAVPLYVGITSFVLAPQGNLLMATPECALVSRAYAQVCRHLGIPNSLSCTHTDSKLPTMQTGYEKMMGLMLALASGSPILQVPAILDDGITTSFEQLAIEAEMVTAVRRLLRGVAVSEETLAEDVLAACVRGEEEFVTHPHTLAHLRSEHWQPQALFRGTWEQLSVERRTLETTAAERVEAALARYQPCPLPEAAEREVDAIVASTA